MGINWECRGACLAKKMVLWDGFTCNRIVLRFCGWPLMWVLAGLIKQSLSRMFEPLFNWAAKRYTAAVGAQLKEYGLRFDDLYDPLHDLVSCKP